MATFPCAIACSIVTKPCMYLNVSSRNILDLTRRRSFHITSQDCLPKYHHIKKKAKLYREKQEALQLKYERLDVEDRPTGCILCPHRNADIDIDYKNVRLLSQFVSPHTGRIYSRRITGLCGRKQVDLTNAINRARRIGLMPVTMKYFDFHADPKLF